MFINKYKNGLLVFLLILGFQEAFSMVPIESLNNKGEYKDELEEWWHTRILWAIFHNDIELAEEVLKEPNINVNVKTSRKDVALLEAVDKNNQEIVKMLLNHNAINIFVKSNPAIYLGYGPDEKVLTVLELAKFRASQLSEEFLKFYPITNYQLILNKLKEWREKLFKVVGDNKNNIDLDTFKFCLIKLGIYVQDNQGNNILHQAIIKNNKEIVQKILCLAPNLLNRKNKSGLTPFDLVLKNLSSSDINNNDSLMKIILDFAYLKKSNSKKFKGENE